MSQDLNESRLGVWKACGKQGSAIRNQRNELIATVNWRGRANHSPLIAAAPELYEALRQFVAWADICAESGAHPLPENYERQARAALAKARGEQ